MTDQHVLRLGEPGGFEIGVADIGASWLSCRVQLHGGVREVLLSPADPWQPGGNPAYIGVTVGRVANRIAGSSFELDGQRHTLVANEGPNHLHGGPAGFHTRCWTVLQHDRDTVRFGLVSPAGDQGYPGRLSAEVRYHVDPARRTVTLVFSAEADATTPVTLTSHAYFNLDGDAADARGHRLRVAASSYLPVDEALIPLGPMEPVAGMPLDLRQLQPIPADPAAHPQLAPGRGVDHCYVLDAACRGLQAPAAELLSSDGQLAMELLTDQPGLQVYTGQHLGGLPGRGGQPLAAYAGIALEPQAYPDSVNRPAWREGVLLRPGQRWERRSLFRFVARP